MIDLMVSGTYSSDFFTNITVFYSSSTIVDTSACSGGSISCSKMAMRFSIAFAISGGGFATFSSLIIIRAEAWASLVLASYVSSASLLICIISLS